MPSLPSAGVSPAASFELAGLERQRPPTPILAEPINARSREVVSIVRGASIADGGVAYLIGLRRGSGGAIRSFGQRFAEVTHVDGESGETIGSMVREALAPLTGSKTVRLGSLEAFVVNPGDGTQLDGRIEYRDLNAPPGQQDHTLDFEALAR